MACNLCGYLKILIMATRNSNEQHQGTGKPQKASGQQTGGKRGTATRNTKDNQEHDRSTEQKRQRGNHGGNR